MEGKRPGKPSLQAKTGAQESVGFPKDMKTGCAGETTARCIRTCWNLKSPGTPFHSARLAHGLFHGNERESNLSGQIWPQISTDQTETGLITRKSLPFSAGVYPRRTKFIACPAGFPHDSGLEFPIENKRILYSEAPCAEPELDFAGSK